MTSDSSDSGDSGSGSSPRAAFVLPDALLTIESIHQAIDAYLEAGLRPILIHAPTGTTGTCTCGHKHDIDPVTGSSSAGKHPIAKNWQKRVATREDLNDHVARLKFTPNVGMVLGRQAAGEYIVSVDVDDLPRFAELEEEFGKLPETARCDSGRGYRLFYTLPSEIDTSELKNITGLGGTKELKKRGVDVKCEAGQVVVAPSLHYNGTRYKWARVGNVVELPMAWALEIVPDPTPPEWVAKYTPQRMQDDTKARKRAARYLEAAVMGRASSLAACGSGMRNTTLYKSAFAMFTLCGGLLLSHEWPYVHNQLFEAARAAGLPEKEVRRTLDSAEKGARESGKVFTPVVLREPDRLPSRPSAPTREQEVPAQEINPNADAAYKRPLIEVTTETADIVDASIAALTADGNLFQRDKTLVFITRVIHEQEVDTSSEDPISIEGNPQTNVATRPMINSKLSRVAIFQKWVESAGGFKKVKPPEDVVAAIHDIHEYPGIRPIVGITETPTLRPDGEIVQEVGYDRKTRYVYLPNQIFPPVPDEKATQENARWCFQFLADIFIDFPYVNASHLSVPIAAILTLVGRPAIQGSVPGFLFDASTRGSGKTLQTDAVATIATGRGAPRMNYPTKDEEMEKVLAGYALKGSSFICLDNVPSMCPFGGGPLDRVLTARDEVDLRVLGHTNVPTLTWRAVVMATGNNIGFRGDTARRVLMARLEPTDENPERRTKFKHNDLLAVIRTQRTRLVAAALCILRAYFRCGCPPMGVDRWGSFEEWSRLAPNAIVFAGGADPMKARPESDGEVDVEAQALATLLKQLPNLIAKLNAIRSANGLQQEIGLAARTIISALYEAQLGSVEEWAVFEPLKEAIEIMCRPRFGKSSAKPEPMALGFKLRSLRKRVIGGNRLVGEPDRNGVMVWHVEKVNDSVN